MRTRLAAAAMAALASIVPATVHAAACSGPAPFGDVPAGDQFCTNVEWVKNRGITTGCGPNAYCPQDPVSRAQMAAFMNRLADAIVQPPVVVNTLPGALALTLLAADNPICSTLIPAATFPRTFVVHAHGTFRTAAIGSLGAHIMNTLDGNTTNWNFATANSQRTTADASTYGTASISSSIAVPANAVVRLAMGVFSVSGSTAVTESRCQITATIQSRTGSVSPYDAIADGPLPGDGI